MANIYFRIAMLAGIAAAFAGMAFGQATIASVTPNSAAAYSQATAITIAGSNFGGATGVVFTPPGGPATTLTPSQVQAAQLAATIPAALLTTAGTAQIAIQSGSVLSNQLPFTITGPAITSLTPNSAIAHSRATAITIAGSNFVDGAVVSFTSPGGAKITLTPSQIQAAQIAATIPSALLTTAGTAQIAIQNGPGALSNQLPFTVGASISVKAPSLSGGTMGTPYSDTLSATGGRSPYTWTLVSGALPAGLSLAPSGTVSGNPSAPGTSGFAVEATDASGGVTSALVSLVVKPGPFIITTGALPSGVAAFDYPQQILAASGGVAPYTFTVTSGSLPPGVTLSNGVIGGTPTTAGTFPFTITASDSAATQAHSDTSINIRPAGADLVLLSGSVSFSQATGATGLPSTQIVGVQSASVAQTLNYTIASSPAPWLSVSGGGATPGSLSFSLTPAALSLAAGTNTATVTLTCTTAPCAGKTQSVAVSLVVTSPPAQLSVSSGLLSFRSSSTPPQPQSQPLGIQNTGGGLLTITSISCEESWCSVGSVPASVSAGPGAQVTITADPSTLSRGFFHTAVDITTSAGSASVPVTFFISSSPGMNLAPAGTQFSMQAGGAPGNASGSFLVNVAGGTLNWSASVLPDTGWLTLNGGSGSGTATDAQSGSIGYSINSTAASLAQGTYFGTIQVSSSGAVNSPQDYQVILNVNPATQTTRVFPQPGGLVFITNVGVAPSPLVVNVYSNSKTPQSYQAAASTETGSWLSLASTLGTASLAAPDHSSVNVDPTRLTAGFYKGSVTYASGSSGVSTVNVLLVIVPAGVPLKQGVHAADAAAVLPAGAPNATTPKAACSPTALVPTQTGLVSNFATPASWPTPLAITLVNDCGGAVPDGQVVATFSNGDPPLALSVADRVSGLYSATWTPRNSAAQVTITARATAAGLPAATAQIGGAVFPNSSPVLTPNGMVHPYNPQIGGALAPGTIVAIYGSNLATTAAQPATTPLPTAMNGTTVLMGGIPAPLFYVGPGQINAQIPFELDPAKQYQVVVSANRALTTPQPLQLTQATPGLDALQDGALVAFHTADGTQVSQTSPAKPGEFIVIFLLGMGPTDNPVITGSDSPSSPLDRPLAIPTLTLGGVSAPVAFAGLTPGFVGLYQINVQIPNVAADGNLVLTVSQNGLISNTTILPVQF